MENIENQTTETEVIQAQQAQDEAQEVKSVADAMFPTDEDSGNADGNADSEQATQEVKDDTPKDAKQQAQEADGKQPVRKDGDNQQSDDNQDAQDEELMKSLSKRAQERFKTLANERRDFLEKYEVERQTSEGFRNIIRESCNNVDEAVALFDYAKAIKTGDFEKAGELLREQVLQYQMVTRKPFEVDALGDLREKIETLEMDETTAYELASSRWERDRQKQAQEAYTNYAQQEAHEQAVRKEAIHQVNTLVKQWQKQDLNWAESEERILKFIKDKAFSQDPRTWVPSISAYYVALSQSARSAQANLSQQPLRSNSTGGAPAPKSVADAMFGF